MPTLRELFIASLTCAMAGGAWAKPKHSAKVVILGFDGVSLNVLEPYAASGVTPNFAKLMSEGVRGHLDSFWPTRTPQVWTSAVTGKLPGQHGVWDHVSNSWYNPPGVRTEDKRVVTARDRKSKALWNILDQKGVRSLVVGWMVTWPAEKLKNGIMVAPKELTGDKRQTTIKGSFYRDIDQVVQPERLWPKVKGMITEAGDITAADVATFADVPPAGSPLFQLPYLDRYMYTFRWSLARARSVEAITLGLLEEAQPDIVLSYFQCPDTMGHRFWAFKEPVSYLEQRLTDLNLPTAHAGELKRRFERAYEACYRDSDERLGRLLEATRGPDTLVLVLSDHGFGHCERPHPFQSEPYGGVHLDQGVFLAAGPGIEAGKTVTGVSVIDIAPTVLHYLGLPVGDDMRGKVAKAIFQPAFSAQREVGRIPTYESAPQLDCSHPEGYPPRQTPPRPTSAQMGGRNPYE